MQNSRFHWKYHFVVLFRMISLMNDIHILFSILSCYYWFFISLLSNQNSNFLFHLQWSYIQIKNQLKPCFIFEKPLYCSLIFLHKLHKFFSKCYYLCFLIFYDYFRCFVSFSTQNTFVKIISRFFSFRGEWMLPLYFWCLKNFVLRVVNMR